MLPNTRRSGRGGFAWLLAAALALPAGPAAAGDTAAPQIAGGSKARAGEFPWQVALLYADEADAFEAQFCGGTLIGPDWVVTAAHCVYDRRVEPAESIDVLVGTTRLGRGGRRVDVRRIVVHPRYRERSGVNDIALLQLAAPVAERPLPLLTRGREARLAAAGTLAIATGWGSTVARGARYPRDLRKVALPIVTNRVCNDRRAHDGDVTAAMLCAGFAAGGKDTCDGDSGGPLIVPDGHGGAVLAGVTSWGARCAAPRKYGVYTRVARYAGWIERVVSAPRRAVRQRPSAVAGAAPP